MDSDDLPLHACPLPCGAVIRVGDLHSWGRRTDGEPGPALAPDGEPRDAFVFDGDEYDPKTSCSVSISPSLARGAGSGQLSSVDLREDCALARSAYTDSGQEEHAPRAALSATGWPQWAAKTAEVTPSMMPRQGVRLQREALTPTDRAGH